MVPGDGLGPDGQRGRVVAGAGSPRVAGHTDGFSRPPVRHRAATTRPEGLLTGHVPTTRDNRVYNTG